MPRTCLWALLVMLAIPGLALGQGEGAKVFERCVPCHRGNGAGMVGMYPPLVKHAPELVTGSRSYLITVLLYGLEGRIDIEGQKTGYDGIMPSHYSLNDEQIADVLNYVLTSWGNDKLLPKDFNPIRTDEIKAQRGKNLSRQQVYQLRKELKLVKWREGKRARTWGCTPYRPDRTSSLSYVPPDRPDGSSSSGRAGRPRPRRLWRWRRRPPECG